MSRFPSAPTLTALAIAILLADPGLAQTTDSPPGQPSIDIEVRLDLSKTGDDRCTIEPEDLWLPKGASQVTWSMAGQGSGSEDSRSGPRLESVIFDPSVPVTSNARVGTNRWRATFDREQALEKVEYEIHTMLADGEVVECYPHVAGSTDQGGGG